MSEKHPIQTPNRRLGQAKISSAVTLRAYEVYSKIWSPQKALIEGNCRGGFGLGELIAFLYARTFDPSEWRQRFDEAIDSMENIDQESR